MSCPSSPGKDAEELENHLYRLFKLHDVDNSGYLDNKEFVACIQSLDLGLTISKPTDTYKPPHPHPLLSSSMPASDSTTFWMQPGSDGCRPPAYLPVWWGARAVR